MTPGRPPSADPGNGREAPSEGPLTRKEALRALRRERKLAGEAADHTGWDDAPNAARPRWDNPDKVGALQPWEEGDAHGWDSEWRPDDRDLDRILALDREADAWLTGLPQPKEPVMDEHRERLLALLRRPGKEPLQPTNPVAGIHGASRAEVSAWFQARKTEGADGSDFHLEVPGTRRRPFKKKVHPLEVERNSHRTAEAAGETRGSVTDRNPLPHLAVGVAPEPARAPTPALIFTPSALGPRLRSSERSPWSMTVIPLLIRQRRRRPNLVAHDPGLDEIEEVMRGDVTPLQRATDPADPDRKRKLARSMQPSPMVHADRLGLISGWVEEARETLTGWQVIALDRVMMPTPEEVTRVALAAHWGVDESTLREHEKAGEVALLKAGIALMFGEEGLAVFRVKTGGRPRFDAEAAKEALRPHGLPRLPSDAPRRKGDTSTPDVVTKGEGHAEGDAA